MTKFHLKNTIIEAIKFHETGYEDDFWGLNSDQLYDYTFYYPNQNPNRLVAMPLNSTVNTDEEYYEHLVI